ncbi:MAG TPA: hypothetical protein VMU52_03890 [Steroidobacteraceae bacterium]|nr:hypothetical protein [Steroidobacteraceae bacterium]
MGKKIREEIWEVMVEGSTDIIMLMAELITAPIMAVVRVLSDFVHRKGRYKPYGGSDNSTR